MRVRLPVLVETRSARTGPQTTSTARVLDGQARRDGQAIGRATQPQAAKAHGKCIRPDTSLRKQPRRCAGDQTVRLHAQWKGAPSVAAVIDFVRRALGFSF